MSLNSLPLSCKKKKKKSSWNKITRWINVAPSWNNKQSSLNHRRINLHRHGIKNRAPWTIDDILLHIDIKTLLDNVHRKQRMSTEVVKNVHDIKMNVERSLGIHGFIHDDKLNVDRRLERWDRGPYPMIWMHGKSMDQWYKGHILLSWFILGWVQN